MKKLVFLIFISVFNLTAQDTLLDILPLVSGEVNYKQVYETIGLSKEALVENAKEWLIDHKATKLNEVELDIKHQTVTGSLTFKTLWGPNDFPELYKEVQFKLEIISKNERYQYKFFDFIVKEPGINTQLEIYKTEKNIYEKYNRDFYLRIDEEIKNMITSLVEKMNEP